MTKIKASEVQIGDAVKGNLISGTHKVAAIKAEGAQMRTAVAKVLEFYNEDGEMFFIGRVYAKATIEN